jgi:NAD(P)-dependent dehydrogenase (short-subunit alcohol dehydrogenase family)
MLKIAVIDGQGGGIGSAIVEGLKKAGIDISILALGTNSIATSAMLRAGADEGATGENAIIYNAKRVDVITGVIAIIKTNALLGEVSE